MKQTKLERQKGALARFEFMSFDDWCAERKEDILPVHREREESVLKSKYKQYIKRKAQEHDTLKATVARAMDNE